MNDLSKAGLLQKYYFQLQDNFVLFYLVKINIDVHNIIIVFYISLDGVDYNHTHLVVEFHEGINLAQFSIEILENPACTDDGNHQFLIDLVETRNIFIPNQVVNISLLNDPPCKFLCMCMLTTNMYVHVLYVIISV